MQAVKDISDWFIGKYYTYVKIYDCASAPHLLPKYIPDKLIVREIAYQMMEAGINAFLDFN
jgi:hypothetical protein